MHSTRKISASKQRPNCFHSLQTGKHMCTGISRRSSGYSEVSIPFKRESTCAPVIDTTTALGLFLFPFPSNGKAHVHSGIFFALLILVFCFHSLQTGKHMCTKEKPVETPGEEGFHSLQTGKHMCTKVMKTQFSSSLILFPFPSNGKAHVHAKSIYTELLEDGRVSIPFKRESTCAQIMKNLVGMILMVVSIPFKRESTCALCLLGAETFSVENGFHSLQTGKHMCTYPIFDPRHAWLRNP